MKKMRTEADSIGQMEVPATAYYGVQTLRARQNFPITHRPLHPEFIKSMAKLKKASAITNRDAGQLPKDISEAIIRACDEVIEGRFKKEFIVDAIQGGAGTSANMNANEVIANRAIELLGGKKGDYSIVHPNDHVNRAQSTNDVFPSAAKLTATKLLKKAIAQLERLEAALSIKNVLFEHLYHKPALNADELMEQLLALREEIRPYVGDAVGFVHKALKEGKTVLLEGQLGSMKDPDLGIFPMTTSSHTLAGFGCVGAAVPPTAIEDVICVTKAYSSSVGSNTEPFVSELLGEEGDELRRRGGDKGEFGATTGRPRRVGWFDAVATKYGCMVQGATQVALTCLDVLGYLDEIKVCTGYEIDGEVTEEFPVTPRLMRAKPVFTTLPGWKCDIRGCKDYDALPQQAKDYVDFLERHIQCPITMVSSGPKREEMTYRTSKL